MSSTPPHGPLVADPLSPRQLRRCVVPLQKLVEYIDRKTKELTNARIYRAEVDPRSARLFLYIETETGEGGSEFPLDFTLDWNEIFGVIPCEVCGEYKGVEDITVCSTCAGKKA